MESLIYVNTENVTAHCTPTGNGPPRVICTLLAHWQAHFSFFVTGEDPAAVAGITLRCVLKEQPTGAVLLASSTTSVSGAVYTFDFASVDSSGLRTLIGDADEIELEGEIEWTLSGRVERVYFPVTVLNSRHRPDDAAPDPADEAYEAWLSARAVRFDEAQTLTTEQKAQARANIGVTSGVSDHGGLTGLDDDDHPHYLNQSRGDARYPLASAMTTALAGKEPVREAATLAELEAGLLASVKSLTPALFKTAVLAIAPGGAGLDLPVSIANGGTGSENAAAARVALGVIEVVAAVAQQTAITINAEASTDWNNNGYIDVAEPDGVVRIWFNVDGMGSAPASDTERLIMVALAANDALATVVELLAAAVAADGAFTVTSNATQALLTANEAGHVGLATTSTNSSIGSVNVDVAGADQYLRLLPTNGEQITHVNAATLQGQAAAEFAAFNHTHAFSQLNSRPRYARTVTPSVSSSTTLANLVSASVEAREYIFEATGFLSSSATTEGLSLAVNGPTFTAGSLSAHITIPTNAIGGLVNGTVTAYETKITNPIGPGAAALGRWHVTGRVAFTAAGTFAIRYSAETGGGSSVTVPAGAVLCVYPVG